MYDILLPNRDGSGLGMPGEFAYAAASVTNANGPKEELWTVRGEAC
jgi:hypothetical protein